MPLESSQCLQESNTPNPCWAMGIVAAVSQTELKPQWALLLPGLCLTAKVQIFYPCPVGNYSFISFVDFIYNSPPEHCLKRSWKCNFIPVSAIVSHSLGLADNSLVSRQWSLCIELLPAASRTSDSCLSNFHTMHVKPGLCS